MASKHYGADDFDKTYVNPGVKRVKSYNNAGLNETF